MAKLYFRYGAMGSSKSANILMVRYNYEERGQYAVLLNQEQTAGMENARSSLVWDYLLQQNTWMNF